MVDVVVSGRMYEVVRLMRDNDAVLFERRDTFLEESVYVVMGLAPGSYEVLTTTSQHVVDRLLDAGKVVWIHTQSVRNKDGSFKTNHSWFGLPGVKYDLSYWQD